MANLSIKNGISSSDNEVTWQFGKRVSHGISQKEL
jgi:hypothetical protein